MKILTFYSPKIAVSSYFIALEIKGGGRPMRPLDPPLRYKHRLSAYIIELSKISVNVSLHAWHTYSVSDKLPALQKTNEDIYTSERAE